jgi:hypothetical protein
MLDYTWSANTKNCSANAPACTFMPEAVGTPSYEVTVKTELGKDTPSTNVTVKAAGTPANLVCTLKPASPHTVTAGNPVTLKADCVPSKGTSYLWSSNTSCAGSETCTVTPTADTTYTVKGSNAGVESYPLSVLVKVIPATTATSYTGMWKITNEDGWGISVTQNKNNDNIFAAIYTYDDAQQPTWYVISDCPITAEKKNGCTGDIYKVTGGSAPLVDPWKKPSKPTSVGSGTFTFTDTATGKFAYTLNGTLGEKAIEKLTFAGTTQPFAVDYTNLWMTAGEDGWGVALTQDKGNIFAAWYAYNTDGAPVWYTAQCTLTGTAADSSCHGRRLRVTGGAPLTSPWSMNRQEQDEGTVTLTFTSNTQGEMVFTPKTVTTVMRKTITPFGF